MIKFRGIPLESVSDIDGVNFDGTFVYGYYVKNGDSALIIGDVLEANGEAFWPSWWVTVDSKTVGQFTGLQDATGNDIYDGDIVHAENEAKYVRNGEVVFRGGAYWYDNGMDSSLLHPTLGMGELTVLEVIGNIYQDKELIDFDKSKLWEEQK